MTKILKDDFNCFSSNGCIIIIGPEGGLDSKEIEFLKLNKFNNVQLGEYILRTETAALVALSGAQSVLKKL